MRKVAEIQKLPQRESSIYDMRFKQGLSRKKTAERLGVCVDTVERIESNIIKFLEQTLDSDPLKRFR